MPIGSLCALQLRKMDFERQGQLLAKRPVMDMPAPGGRTDMPRWWARVSF